MKQSEEIRAEAPKGFDPLAYARGGGWSWYEIAATARQGVAPEDKERLEETYGDSAQAMVACLQAYCEALVDEGSNQ